MYEPFEPCSEVDESAELGHVCHRAWQDHPFAQLCSALKADFEQFFLQLVSRVLSGLQELVPNTFECPPADFFGDVFFPVNFFDELGVTNQRPGIGLNFRSNPPDDLIAFGMDARTVEGLVAICDTNETSELLKDSLVDSFDGFEFF